MDPPLKEESSNTDCDVAEIIADGIVRASEVGPPPGTSSLCGGKKKSSKRKSCKKSKRKKSKSCKRKRKRKSKSKSCKRNRKRKSKSCKKKRRRRRKKSCPKPTPVPPPCGARLAPLNTWHMPAFLNYMQNYNEEIGRRSFKERLARAVASWKKMSTPQRRKYYK